MRLSGCVAMATFVVSLAVAGTIAAVGPSSAVGATPGTPAPGAVYTVAAAAQGGARSYWTPGRMAAAAGDIKRQMVTLGPLYSVGPFTPLLRKAPPSGAPHSVSFDGVPTVGALFYTKGSSRHFCTASVVRSAHGDLLITAAHCVYDGGYSANLEFVPGYHSGAAPYGAWPVSRITVAKGWRQRQDPSLDYAFLTVVAPPQSAGQIQDVTGALNIGFHLHDAQHVTVIGYNDTNDQPIRCATTSFKFSNSQMEFYCRGFWYGTSGGPWIIGYNGGSGTGTVFGVIGGYEWGGYTSWASYSTILWQTAQALFRQAEAY